MNDAPRRRRLEPDEPKGGLPIFPLIVVVVLAGLLLGGLISRIYKPAPAPPGPSSAPSITPLPVAQNTPPLAPRPTVGASASASPSAKPSPSASASPTAHASPTPKASATSTPTAQPTRTPTAAPTVIFITPSPKASKIPVAATTHPAPTPTPVPKPTETPTPVQITGTPSAQHANSIVLAYLGAVSRGDESLAASYLTRGLPNESFMTASSHVSDVTTTTNGDGTYKVTATIATATGEYFETFKLENGPNGLQISDHYAIKVQ